VFSAWGVLTRLADDKNFFDYISDWFKTLLESGPPALLVGLGWVSVFLPVRLT